MPSTKFEHNNVTGGKHTSYAYTRGTTIEKIHTVCKVNAILVDHFKNKKRKTKNCQPSITHCQQSQACSTTDFVARPSHQPLKRQQPRRSRILFFCPPFLLSQLSTIWSVCIDKYVLVIISRPPPYIIYTL